MHVNRSDALRAGFALACIGLAWAGLAGRELVLPAPLDSLRLARPAALGLLGALPLLLGLERGPRGWLGPGLRAACFSCLVLALCRPELQAARARVALVAAVDVSESVGAAALAEADRWVTELRAALDRTGGDTLHVLSFAREPRWVAPGTRLSRHPQGAGEATNIQAAVELAYRAFDGERLPALLLITDGLETRGDLAREAERAALRGVRIDFMLPPRAREPADVAVRSLEPPADIALGVPFTLHATIDAERPARVRARLVRAATEVAPAPAEQSRELELAAGPNTVAFEVTIDEPGRAEYRLELQPERPDRVPANDQGAVALEVPSPARVLILDSEPQLMTSLARALRERDFEVDVRPAAAAPRDVAGVAPYAFVVLSDVPAAEVRPETVAALRTYVEELGGGLLVSGGTQGLSLGGYQGTALERLLPVGTAGEEQRDRASLALALVIDCSGSMAGDKLDLAREAATLTAQTLTDTDLIEVIGFSSEPERRVRLQAASNRASIAQNIAQLSATGGTQLYPALEAAYRDLRGAQAKLKQVILLTDGQTQEAGIEDLASSMRADGITLSTVGLGTEVNRALLETLAGLGGGRAYFPLDAQNVPQIFLSEASRHKRPTAVDRTTRAYEREPASFLRGLALRGAPPLAGYVQTQAKPRPAQVILDTERGEPLLARWRLGLGYVLAWTSDLKPRWAASWLEWRSFGRFIAQLVREHQRVSDQRRLSLAVRRVRDRAHITADVIDSDDRFENGLEAHVRMRSNQGVVGAAGLRQVGPARYAADLPLPGRGAFTFDAIFRRSGRQVATGAGQLALPYPAEFAVTDWNHTLLRETARRTGGQQRREPRRAFEPGQRRALVRDALWPTWMWLALGFFLLEQWMRRGQTSGKNARPGAQR